MSLSRKRQKELKRLRADAEELWRSQQAVMDRANDVAREARRQAARYTREEVAPVVRDRYDQYVRPSVDRGVLVGRRAAGAAGDLITGAVVPAVGTAIGTALSVADVAKDTRVQAAVKRLNGSAKKERHGLGFGGVLAIGVGLVAVVGIGYAVWQTFRADDELWVADDEIVAEPDAQ